MKKLSPKQRRFVSEYLKDQNAAKAYIRAGYSARNAETHGPRLARKGQVCHAIDVGLKKIEDLGIVDAKYILEALKEVALRCMQRVPVMEFDRVERQMVQATDGDGHAIWEFDSMGANKSLELLGKHIRFFPAERREVTGADGSPLVPHEKDPDLSTVPTKDLVAHIKSRGAAECAPHS